MVCFQPGSAFAETERPEFNLIKTDSAELPQSETVRVEHDPVYKTAKEYRAFPLAEILKRIPVPESFKQDEWVIVLTAVDGYKVSMAYRDAMSEQGYIAVRDLAAPDNKKWLDFKFGKQTMTPAPYYLVWPKKDLDEWRYPWPFQLASIALQPANVYFGSAAPSGGDRHVNAGFNAFSRYCIRCHSVNLSGGEVGPELNVPKNITEYFKEEALAGFILNAASYRSGTKMPVFEKLLTREDAQDIVVYLKHMSQAKKIEALDR